MTDITFQPPPVGIDPEDMSSPLPDVMQERVSRAYEELFAANREVRRLRVVLNLIANAPRKCTVADLKTMAVEALVKRRGDE